jgi:hypothetical protein
MIKRTIMIEARLNPPKMMMQRVHIFVRYKTNPPTFQIRPNKIDKNSTQLNHSIRHGFIFRHTTLKKASENMLIEIKAISTVDELEPAYDKRTLLATRTNLIWKYKTK